MPEPTLKPIEVYENRKQKAEETLDENLEEWREKYLVVNGFSWGHRRARWDIFSVLLRVSASPSQ
jgi:hypothetical protein